MTDEVKEAPQQPERPRGFWAWLRQAFAVEAYDESSLSEDDREILQKIARRIHERNLTAAAILWAQSNRNINFLSSQALVFAEPVFHMTHPFLNAIMGRFGIYLHPEEYPKLYAALEKRYSVEYFITQLEALEAGAITKPNPPETGEQIPPSGDKR